MQTYSSFEVIRIIWGYIRPYRAKYLFATILRVLAEIAWLYPTFALAAIINFFTNYQSGDSLREFWIIMILFGLSAVFYFGGVYLGNLIGYRIAKRVGIDTEIDFIRHILSLDIEWHEKENTGNKIKKIDRGSEAINMLLRSWFSTMIGIGVNIIGVAYIISKFDLKISIATIIFLIIYAVVGVFFIKKATSIHRLENVKEEEFSGLEFETVNNVRSAKVMSMVKPLHTRISHIASELKELAFQRIFWFQSSGLVKNMFAQAFRLGMTTFIGWGIIQGYYEISFLIIFYGYFSTIQHAVANIVENAQDFAMWKQSVGRMTELLKTHPVTDIEDGKVNFPNQWKSIVFKNVSFSYGNKKVLDGISFTITKGEKIGIVGLSGAGKSTLFKLLLKERESYEGDILVDGVPLKNISKTDYFKHTAVVLQDTEVFNLTLKDNVTISNIEKSNNEELLQKALNIAHVNEFAKLLPSGINTFIGEKGVKLSGGEKQRVGIARAVFKEPELLLLDEATSHLDVESEEKIQDSLHQFFQSVTAIVIAHRLTTIKEMDKILMIENGKIIEQGSFNELYSKKGRFFELWEKQKL